MRNSPFIRKILSLISSSIWIALDVLIHQSALSLILILSAEKLPLEARVFMSGVIVVCFAFSGLYRLGSLARPFTADIARAGLLALFLSVLFAVCSEETVPLSSIVGSMAVFSAVSIFVRHSMRRAVSAGMAKILRVFGAKAAFAGEVPQKEADMSLRKDYRYDMKSVLAKKSRAYMAVKRAFDVFSSGLALVVLSPVFLATSIAIKLEDGGPVFFSAERYGRNMTTFYMHKFRSMIPNAESKIGELLKDNEMTGHTFKIKDDPRITRVGKFIRKYSIDELPQLWNIFVGDMSVVGPRPVITLDMENCDDYDKQRWLVRPGLTCYWQVSGRADVKWAQWIEMDLDYIENMSLWEDFKLILKTFPVVLKGEGAY